MRNLDTFIAERRAQSLYRASRPVERLQGPRVRIEGRELLAFASNDYLGLADHPAVVAAGHRGLDRYGVGSGAAHLITGHSPAHQALEEDLADFTGRPRALLFSTGYMANLGIIAGLCGHGDTVFQDRLNHASLLDGARLAGARFRRYPHRDVSILQRWLGGPAHGERLIASDGVFSMDGDLAPVPALAHLAREAGAWLLVDDAHGLGILGEQGGGTLEYFGLGIAAVPILMGTLGKALGTFGAFVAGSDALIETLVQSARSYIYTTAPPPAWAEASRAALALIRTEPWRRQRVLALAERLRHEILALGLSPGWPGSDTASPQLPIVPLIVGGTRDALDWSRRLEWRGLLVPPVRPPTVPEGQARLRITLSAAHSDTDLDRLVTGLAEVAWEINRERPA